MPGHPRSSRVSEAFGVEVGQMAALGTCGRVDDAVDQRRAPRGERLAQSCSEFAGGGGAVARAAERLDELVVAGADRQRRWGGVGGDGVDVVAFVDAAVVEHHDHDRQVVAAYRFQLHAGESECAVALDRDDRTTGFDGGGDGVAHADAHDSPGAAVEAVPRQVHVYDVAGEVEGVGALVDDVGLRVRPKHVADRSQRTVELHRVWIWGQSLRHLGGVLVRAGGQRGARMSPWLCSMSACISEPMSPASGAAIGWLLSNSAASMSTWMNLASGFHCGASPWPSSQLSR